MARSRHNGGAAAVDGTETAGAGQSPLIAPLRATRRGRALVLAVLAACLLGVHMALPANAATTRFSDVVPGSFYEDAVEWMVETELTTGTSPTTFSPEDPVTRAQLAAFLWRFAGSPDIGLPHVLGDVTRDSFYERAVEWLVATRLTTGTTPTTFSPDDPVTRAQLATFLWRFSGEPRVNGTHPFIDVVPGAFYERAVEWLATTGLTTGTSPTTFSPDIPITRAQLATFLWRYQPPSWPEVAGARVPGLCTHDPVTLVDGEDTTLTVSEGYFRLDRELPDGQPALAFGLPSNDAGPLTVVAASCSAGGVGWPHQLMLFSSGGEFYATTDLLSSVDWASLGLNGPARNSVRGLRVDGTQLIVELGAYTPGESGCCYSGHATVRLVAGNGGVTVTSAESTEPTMYLTALGGERLEDPFGNGVYTLRKATGPYTGRFEYEATQQYPGGYGRLSVNLIGVTANVYDETGYLVLGAFDAEAGGDIVPAGTAILERDSVGDTWRVARMIDNGDLESEFTNDPGFAAATRNAAVALGTTITAMDLDGQPWTMELEARASDYFQDYAEVWRGNATCVLTPSLDCTIR